ncbi:hypothetical protein [Sphingobium sp. CCH11-B1]|uniref:hypothetical protein n=1 Tax=Sphingobium sp. CCH11-B1 TaxID=1768781 RepID=UPI0008359F32|nr:hypothetical protein [Sphingobium sp. CCH11-B1]
METVASIGTIASVAAGALTVASVLTAKKPTAQASGSQTQFSADPDAGIPLVIGRTGNASDIVFRRGWDTADKGDNDRQAFVAVHSLGPIDAIERFTVDKSQVTFNSAGQAIGAFAGFMWMVSQLGATPEPSALSFGAGAGSPPGWTTQHKLSGKAASAWTLRFDTKAKLYQNGPPAPMWTIRGIKAYDPRKDSTYPGGSGPHRMADPSDTAAYDAAVDTWEWTEDPYLIGLRWAHGIWQRDRSASGSVYQRVMGMGAPWETIDVPAFVEGANVAQANGWKVGGVIYSGDGKWDSMKKILQAGMGEPLTLGARISCLVNAPKVSLATVTVDDLVGPGSVAATQPRRDRINTITPRFRLEENNWQLLPAAPISVPAHVAEDRGKRSRVQDYPFIQQTKQAAVAARYDIENAREFGPISLPLKLVWMGYKPGDCVTAILPELGLNGQPILLLNRELSPATGIVTMTARSETAGKHPFALGQTTTPPPTPGVSGPPLVPVPGSGSWSIVANKIEADGAVSPAIVVAGATDAATAEAVVIEYRRFVSGQSMDAGWLSAGTFEPSLTRHVITGVEGGTAYEVGISYQRRGVTGGRLIVGPSETGWTALDFDNVTGPNKPENGATVGATPEQVSLMDQIEQQAAAAAAAAAEAQAAIAQAQQDIAEITGAIEGDFGLIMDELNDLRSDLTATEGNISALQSASSAVQQSVSTLQGDVTGLQNQAADILSSIGQIGTEVDQLNAAVVTQGGSILTLQQSVTSLNGSVTTLRQQVRAGGNLLTNTDFAADTSGWTFANAGQPGAAGGRDLAGDQWRLPGGHNIGITQPNANSGSHAEWTQKVPVISGAWYEFSSRVAAHRCAAEIILQWLDANGQWINPPTPSQSVATYPQGGAVLGNWFHAGVKGQAPAGAASAVLHLRKQATSAGTTDSYAWFCQPMFRPSTADATFPSAYSPGSAQASIETQAQAISTATASLATLTTRVGTAEAEILSTATAISAANGSLASLSTRVGTAESSIVTLQSASSTQAGQIASLSQTVTTQGASIATNVQAISTAQGSLATLTNVVSASSNPNVLPNGGFENGLAGWVASGSAGAPLNWFQAINAAWGSYAANTTPWTGTSTLQFAHITSQVLNGIDVGSYYTAAVDAGIQASQPGAEAWVQFIWSTPSGPQYVDCPRRQVGTGIGFEPTGASRAAFQGTRQVPAGATGVQISLVVYAPPGVTINSMAWRQVKLERGSIATPYSGEASARQTYQAYSTLNSSFASLSTTVSSQGGSITTLQQSFTNLNGTVSTLSSTVSAQGSSISSLQSASSTQAGQIATLQTQVTAGGGNLLVNTDLAADTAGWVFNSGNGTIGDRVGSGDPWIVTGENGLRATLPSTQSAGQGDWTQELALEQGKWYDVSVYAASHRCNIQVYLQFLDVGGGVLSTPSSGLIGPTGGGINIGDFARRSFKAQAPAGTVRGRLFLHKFGTLSGANSYAWWLRPQVAETTAAAAASPAYSPGSARSSIAIQAQAISTINGQQATLSSTVATQGASISQNATAISNLQGSQASLSSTVSSQGAAISNLQTATSTIQGDVATLTTTVSAGATNLVAYGSFPDGLTGWATTGTWSASSANDPSWGRYVSALGVQNAGDHYASTAAQPAIVGDPYTITADIDRGGTTGGVAFARIVWLNSSGSVHSIGPTIYGTGSFTNDFSQRQRATQDCPSGAVQFFVQLGVEGSPTAGNIAFRQVKVVNGTVIGRFSDEATVSQSFQTLSTLNTQYASLSSTVSVLNASVSTNASAITNLQGQYASLSSTVSVLGGTVSQQSLAIADINGKVSLYWQVVATGPNGEVYVRLVNSAGQSGFFVGTGLYVDGDAFINGTVNPEALALDRFVKRDDASGSGSPARGQSLLLYADNLGVTTPNGSYVMEINAGFQTTVGNSITPYNGKPFSRVDDADGGIRIALSKNGTEFWSTLINASEWQQQNNTNLRSYSTIRTFVADAPGGSDAGTGNVVVAVYAVQGASDTGVMDEGDSYSQQRSANYSSFAFTMKTKWTFI